MPNYQKMYLTMFHAATDALEVAVEDGQAAAESPRMMRIIRLLSDAQRECEEIYMAEERRGRTESSAPTHFI